MRPSRLAPPAALIAALAFAPPLLAGSPPGAKPSGLASRQVRPSEGSARPLVAPKGGALVLVFYSPECPISNAYSPKLNEVARAFPADKLTMIGLSVDPDRSEAQVDDHAKEFGLAFPVAIDRSGSVAAKLGVKVTPEVAVLDDRDVVRYQGRIDDQYAARGVRKAQTSSDDLKNAVTAVLAGREVAVARVEAVGCPLPDPPKAAVPTYSETVAGILKQHCQECHRPGQVGPFSLTSYEQARKRASDIATVVESRQMPPWKPSPHFGPKYKYDKSLSEDEIAKVVAWAENGTPEGDKAAVPAPLPPAPEWALGQPDLVIAPQEDFAIPATGDDIYRCFVIPTDLPHDMYVSAIEYNPGNRKVVHHVLSYVDTTGKARERDNADPGLGYSCFSGPGVEVHGDLGGWAPGNEPTFLPDGVGRSLPKKSDVIVQVHYHPSGKPESDRTRIGLHFSKKPIRQILHWAAALNPGMVLPAGREKIEVPAAWVVPADVEALAVTPHMHLLGKDMTMVLTDPEGKRTELVRIDDWDFQWQNTYYFEKPLRIRKGSTLGVVAHYDNTEKNARNPNHPPKEVRWGEATTDEMCIGFLAVTKVGQDLTRPGEVDDLGTIIDRSYKEMEEEYRKKMEEHKARMKAEKDKPAPK